MKAPALLATTVIVGLAASGCGLKGPLYLPEKSGVVVRPGPATTAPAEPASPEQGQAAPEPAPEPEQPQQAPPPGTDRG